MKNWFRERLVALLDNFIWFVMILIVPLILVQIVNLYKENSQTLLLLTVLVLTVVNLAGFVILLSQQRLLNKNVRDLIGSMQSFLPMESESNPLEYQLRHEFEISNKDFDEEKSPQKIIVEFTNRGNNTLDVQKVSYSQTGLGLPASALSSEYRKDSEGHCVIPFDKNLSEVSPGDKFTVVMNLSQKWNKEDIYRLTGEWGYLHLSVIYKDESVVLFKKI